MHLPHPPPSLPVAAVYIDESSQTKNRYLVLGCIIAPVACACTLETKVDDLKDRARIRSEMKWGRVSLHHYEHYKALVDLFFEPKNIGPPLDFHTLVVDTTQLNDRRFNLGNREVGFNKEIYQLILKIARLYRDHNFYTYLDSRDSTQPVAETRLIANRGIMRKNPRRDWPVRRLHMRDSKRTPALQVVDVMLGALAYRLNGHDLAVNASRPKRDLSAYILRRAGVQNVFIDTAISGKFTIWHRRLR